uniref:HMA domain-containing protein n=1 Tax=Elaeophora elaphi TaxID=1147741 RepID=A0A0R3RKM0_9BILA
MNGFSQSSTEIDVNLELGATVSTETKVVLNSRSLETSQPIEVKAKSNSSLMLKEGEQIEEVLALPSPGTLNDMMSKVQSKLQF